jgi:hypothetical protein
MFRLIFNSLFPTPVYTKIIEDEFYSIINKNITTLSTYDIIENNYRRPFMEDDDFSRDLGKIMKRVNRNISKSY